MHGAESWYALGQGFGNPVAGRRERALRAEGGASRHAPQRGQVAPGVNLAGAAGQFNQAARLRAGHLLVVYLGANACFQVDPDSGRIEYLFSISHEQAPFLWRVVVDRSGRIFATLSGAKDMRSSCRDAVFGLAGAVVEVNHRLATIRTVAAGTSIVDPDSLQILDEARLLVCDFGGSGQTGSIYAVDRHTGEVEPRASGGLLKNPVSAIQDEEGVLWVANADPRHGRGVHRAEEEEEGGELLRIAPDGEQAVVVPRQDPAAGSMVGIHSANDDEHLIAIKRDGSTMEAGAVLRVNKKTCQAETLLAASPGASRLYSTHVDVSGDVLWVGESYRKQLLGYDLKKKAVVKAIDFSPAMGGTSLKVASSFVGIESVSLIPRDLEG